MPMSSSALAHLQFPGRDDVVEQILRRALRWRTFILLLAIRVTRFEEKHVLLGTPRLLVVDGVIYLLVRARRARRSGLANSNASEGVLRLREGGHERQQHQSEEAYHQQPSGSLYIIIGLVARAGTAAAQSLLSQ